MNLGQLTRTYYWDLSGIHPAAVLKINLAVILLLIEISSILTAFLLLTFQSALFSTAGFVP